MSAMVGASTTELMESLIGGGVSIVHNLFIRLDLYIIDCFLKNMYSFFL